MLVAQMRFILFVRRAFSFKARRVYLLLSHDRIQVVLLCGVQMKLEFDRTIFTQLLLLILMACCYAPAVAQTDDQAKKTE